MATLEKIRSKSVLLVVIIAVALLAFILGDLITNGRNLFGNDTTVGKVDDKKLEYQEYALKQQQLSKLNEDMRSVGGAYDNQALSQEAFDALVLDKIKADIIDKMDYKSTQDILRYYMLELPSRWMTNAQDLTEHEAMLANATMLPEMKSFLFGNFQGQLTPEQAYNLIYSDAGGANNAQVEALKQQWVSLEQLYEQNLPWLIYVDLLEKSVKASGSDIAAAKNGEMTKTAKVAKKAITQADLDKVAVSDKDIQDAYNQRKDEFKVSEPTKEVSMLVVPVRPSQKDKMESTKLAQKAASELMADGLSKETRRAGVSMNRGSLALDSIDQQLAGNPLLIPIKNFLSTAQVGNTNIVKDDMDGFLVLKLTARDTRPGKVTYSRVSGLDGVSDIDVLAYLNRGESMDSIDSKFPGVKVESEETTLEALALPQSTETLLLGNIGRYQQVKGADGKTELLAIMEQGDPVGIVKFEQAAYVLRPSDETVTNERQRLENYAKQNSNSTAFAQNYNKNGYSYDAPVVVNVSQSTPAILMMKRPGARAIYYPDSSPVASWANRDASDGSISDVFQSTLNNEPVLYIAAVTSEFDDYAPWNSMQVRNALDKRIRTKKAGEAMIGQYRKGTLEETADAMGVQASDITVGAGYNPVVADSRVRGRMVATEPSEKMMIVAGEDGVYAFVITGNGPETEATADKDLAKAYFMKHHINPESIVRHNRKVENYLDKFEQKK